MRALNATSLMRSTVVKTSLLWPLESHLGADKKYSLINQPGPLEEDIQELLKSDESPERNFSNSAFAAVTNNFGKLPFALLFPSGFMGGGFKD